MNRFYYDFDETNKVKFTDSTGKDYFVDNEFLSHFISGSNAERCVVFNNVKDSTNKIFNMVKSEIERISGVDVLGFVKENSSLEDTINTIDINKILKYFER